MRIHALCCRFVQVDELRRDLFAWNGRTALLTIVTTLLIDCCAGVQMRYSPRRGVCINLARDAQSSGVCSCAARSWQPAFDHLSFDFVMGHVGATGLIRATHQLHQAQFSALPCLVLLTKE